MIYDPTQVLKPLQFYNISSERANEFGPGVIDLFRSQFWREIESAQRNKTGIGGVYGIYVPTWAVY